VTSDHPVCLWASIYLFIYLFIYSPAVKPQRVKGQGCACRAPARQRQWALY
jgi:hypothetical protein